MEALNSLINLYEQLAALPGEFSALISEFGALIDKLETMPGELQNIKVLLYALIALGVLNAILAASILHILNRKDSEQHG